LVFLIHTDCKCKFKFSCFLIGTLQGSIQIMSLHDFVEQPVKFVLLNVVNNFFTNINHLSNILVKGNIGKCPEQYGLFRVKCTYCSSPQFCKKKQSRLVTYMRVFQIREANIKCFNFLVDAINFVKTV